MVLYGGSHTICACSEHHQAAICEVKIMDGGVWTMHVDMAGII